MRLVLSGVAGESGFTTTMSGPTGMCVQRSILRPERKEVFRCCSNNSLEICLMEQRLLNGINGNGLGMSARKRLRSLETHNSLESRQLRSSSQFESTLGSQIATHLFHRSSRRSKSLIKSFDIRFESRLGDSGKHGPLQFTMPPRRGASRLERCLSAESPDSSWSL
jgi:hypothetical protein